MVEIDAKRSLLSSKERSEAEAEPEPKVVAVGVSLSEKVSGEMIVEGGVVVEERVVRGLSNL